MPIQSYKDLIVWQKSMRLVSEVYQITKQLPKSEIYGLTAQMQRASVAIPSNITEGYMRNHRREYIQFLSIALASAAELHTQLTLSKEIYVNTDHSRAEAILDEILRMLFVLIKKLKAKI